MTMLDEDRLSALLGHAAGSFGVPAEGPDEIVARARGAAAGDDERGEPTEAEEGDGAGAADRGAAASPTSGRGRRLGAADRGAAASPTSGRGRRLGAAAARHRILSVAAGLVVALLVAGTIAAAVRAPSTPTVTAGLKEPHAAGSGGVHPPLTTTTLPTDHAAPAAGSAGAGAPSFSAQGTTSSAGPSTAQNTPSLPKDSVGQSAKIEQTGTLDLAVAGGDLSRTMARLSGLAGANGGFVANSQSQSGSSGGAPFGSITLEVPVDNFSSVLKQAEQYGKTSNVSTKATDVTGQYVDLQARLTALEASRQQYLTILAKATSIGDILAVQEQLDGIQSQIEQLQGQLQVLTSETSYSTLNVTVNERGRPPQPGPLPESGLVQAWHDSLGGFVAGVEGVIRLAGPFLFALLCLAVVAVGGRVLWRRYQRHRL